MKSEDTGVKNSILTPGEEKKRRIHRIGKIRKKNSDNMCEEKIMAIRKRLQPSGGYHAVLPHITGTFMPPKPDLVFHTTPIAVETDHSAFTVQLSPSKPTQYLSHTTRPLAPIIEDWVSDSEDESEINDPQSVPSFVQSVDHLIKDCNYHAKKKTQPTPRKYAHRGNNKQNALFTHKHLPKNMVHAAVLTQFKLVSITAVRPVCAVVPKTMVTRPRHAHSINTKSKSPIRRHIIRSPSPKTSNSPPRVTAAQALVVGAAKGKKVKWVWRPKFPILDHDLRTTSVSMILKQFDYNDALGRSKKFNFSKYIFDSLVINVNSSSKFYMYPRVGKGFSGVETPLFEGMLVAGEIKEQGDAEEQEQDNVDDAAQGADTSISRDDVQDQYIPLPTPPQQPQDIPSTSQEALDACAALTRRVKHLEHDKRIESSDDTIMEDVSNLGRMIDELDRDEGVALMGEKEEEKKAEEIDMDHPSKVLSMHEDDPVVQEVVEVVTTSKLIREVVTAASTPVSAASTIIPAAEPKIPTATITVAPFKVAAATRTAAPVRVAATSTRSRKRVVIRDPEEESTVKTPAETKFKDKGKGIMVEEPKPIKKKQQSKEQVEEEENRALEGINETLAQKVAKRRKLNEEVKEFKELKQHLEIVPDEDDDVYTEATPLASVRVIISITYMIIGNPRRRR
nr:hypothetical protein [Tanacetum cinerariifolium]